MHKSYKIWLENGCHKVYCKCGCDKEIIIKNHHKYAGIPIYIIGHGNKGKIIHTKKSKNKISMGNSGKHPTKEAKQKMSEKKMGYIPWNKGKHLSREHIENIKKNHADLSNDKHYNWKGGISRLPYCYKFNNQLKKQIRSRDNEICQNCGKTKIENKWKLSVHHIHYDKENCYPNLISLCISCNSKVNFNRNYWEEHFMKILKRRNLLNYFSDKK